MTPNIRQILNIPRDKIKNRNPHEVVIQIKKVIIDSHETPDGQDIFEAAQDLKYILQKIEPNTNGESIRNFISKATKVYTTPKIPVKEGKRPFVEITENGDYLVLGEAARELSRIAIAKSNAKDKGTLQKITTTYKQIIQRLVSDPQVLYKKGLILYGTRVPQTSQTSIYYNVVGRNTRVSLTNVDLMA